MSITKMPNGEVVVSCGKAQDNTHGNTMVEVSIKKDGKHISWTQMIWMECENPLEKEVRNEFEHPFTDDAEGILSWLMEYDLFPNDLEIVLRFWRNDE